MKNKKTIGTLMQKKHNKEKITMLTAYDYPMGLLEEKAGIDIILVGDSLGMTVFGFSSTLPVTMDMMVRHTEAVRKGAPTPFLVGDMPFMSYQTSKEEAIKNAGRLIATGGSDCIKLEGGRNMAETVRAIVNATIPVMGHIGLTPQSLSMLGGFKAQGRSAEAALNLIKDAEALEEAGVCALLVEAVPPVVGKAITERLTIPVIGIGAGPDCDGQLLIVHDMLGFFEAFIPKFVKQYENLNVSILKAMETYVDDVRDKRFPELAHNYKMSQVEEEKFLEQLQKI